MKKFVSIILVLIIVLSMFAGCGSKKESNKVVIWTSTEDYKCDYYLSELKKKFPDYDITLEYMGSSDIAAKVIEEGANCSCDIVVSEERSYMNMMSDNLVELKDFDYSIFLDDLVPETKTWTAECKNGGCIVINNTVIKEKGLDVPTSYEDLLDPQYKGLISMPSPAASGTGYMFLRQLTNEWGEDEAFAYFEKLTENILQYTSSGSGPVNALVQGEVAIGLGMTSQAVVQINDGVDLSIIFFEEGSPFSIYTNGIVKKEGSDRKCVKDVFNYLAIDLAKGDNELYFPDQIFKDFKPTVEGFPTDFTYGDMSNDTRSEKVRLLERWTFS